MRFGASTILGFSRHNVILFYCFLLPWKNAAFKVDRGPAWAATGARVVDKKKHWEKKEPWPIVAHAGAAEMGLDKKHNGDDTPLTKGQRSLWFFLEIAAWPV